MIRQLVEKSILNRWYALLATLCVAAAGVFAFQRLPIDAYPDIAAQSVWIVTTYPGRAPEEVERRVTVPIEIAMRNVPKVYTVRSQTIFGLSLVQLLFDEGTETYWARQRVQEKLTSVELPEGTDSELAPITSPCGEILRYELVSDGTTDLMERRTLNEWVIIPRLLRVPGVADVSNFGGLAKQFAVTYQPKQLERFGITLDELINAVQVNNTSAGGSVLPRGSMSLVIRSAGLLESAQQIENIFVKTVAGTPIYLRDVAAVGVEPMYRSGIFGKDQDDDSVEGIVLLRRGENPSQVLRGVKAALQELNATELPSGTRIAPFYDRQHLVDGTLHTVAHSVALGITLVVLVLLLFLGRPSMAALIAATIPFSLLFALLLMYLTNIPIGLLSVGAIDFGIIVDGAVIVGENIARRLREASRAGSHDRTLGSDRRDITRVVLTAVAEVQRPVFYSMLMVIVAYVPLLALTSIEGLLFRPMALTMVYALIGAMLFALFVVPVLATILFRRGYLEIEHSRSRFVRDAYARVLRRFIAYRWALVSFAICLVAIVALRIVPKLGMEFLPYLDEGPVWVKANFPEGTSLEQTAKFADEIRAMARTFPEVRFVSTQTGRTEAWTEPFPPSRIELMIGLEPIRQWRRFSSKHQFVDALGVRLRSEFPTTRFVFTQPIIDMVTQDTNGTSANVAVQFTGDDAAILRSLGEQTRAMLSHMRGASDANIEQEGLQAQLRITPDRQLCARYNVRIDDVTKLIDVALGGAPVGTIYERDRRFSIVVKLDRSAVRSPEHIGRLMVYGVEGQAVPLSQVSKIELLDGQTIIARENGKRLVAARCDIVGRDAAGFVKEAQHRFNREIAPNMPPGYRVQWLGMFENLERSYQHFRWVIPATVGLIFLLLWTAFRSLRSALLVLLGIPFACVGGVLALYLRGMHLNVSTGVGFAALFGIALMDGVLMVRGITVVRRTGAELSEAIVQGALRRLRPILVTAIVAIFGLLPASLANGLGSDIQRPLATVIVWGLVSSTVLTLFVLPVLYWILAPPIPRLSDAE